MEGERCLLSSSSPSVQLASHAWHVIGKEYLYSCILSLYLLYSQMEGGILWRLQHQRPTDFIGAVGAEGDSHYPRTRLTALPPLPSLLLLVATP